MNIQDVVNLFNFIFLYIFNRHCHGRKTEIARLVGATKSDVTGWLTQIEHGSMSPVATGKAILLCLHKDLSLDDVLSAYKASDLAHQHRSCPYACTAIEKNEIAVERMRNATDLDKEKSAQLARLVESLLAFMMDVFCGDDNDPGLCRRKYDIHAKKKVCSFDECPCNIICKAMEIVSSLMME